MKFSISSIQFTNYRQYRGTHTLNFKMDSNKNVSIILGKNGAGKSNLLNALTWCLYEIEAHKDDNIVSDGMPIINTAEILSLSKNQSTYAEVIIQLDTDIGPWTICRKIEGTKNNDGNFIVDKNTHLKVTHPVGNQDKIDKGKDTEIFINNLLPEALRNFFFIDGEKLREFFETSEPENIVKAIDVVSQLQLVYNSAEHFALLEKSLRKNIRSTTPQLKQIQKKIEDIQILSDSVSESIKNRKHEINININELKIIKDYLKNNTSQNISSLESERQVVEEDIANLKKIIHSLELERNSYLVDIAPFIYLQKTLMQSYEIIESKVKKGELPSRIRETFIQELLEAGRCICGNVITNEERKELEEYNKKLVLSELSDISIVGKTTIIDIFDRVKDFPVEIDKMNENIDDLEDQLEQKQRRKQYISDLFKQYDVAEINLKEERRTEIEIFNAKAEQINDTLLSDLEVYTNNLSQYRKEESVELLKDKKNSELDKKLRLVQKALEILADTEKNVKIKIKNEVEKKMNISFSTLIRKKSVFKNISINDDYGVKIQHIHGYNAINDLSAGEYLILGLSFMSALMSISGFQAPVIIDTPLAKIDDEHREYITTELPKFLNGTQLILLVTPTEYDENVKSNLNNYLIETNFYKITESEIKTESMVSPNVY